MPFPNVSPFLCSGSLSFLFPIVGSSETAPVDMHLPRAVFQHTTLLCTQKAHPASMKSVTAASSTKRLELSSVSEGPQPVITQPVLKAVEIC